MFRLVDRLGLTRPAARERGIALMALTLALGYVIFISHQANIAPGGADSSGYFNLAHMLLVGQFHATPRVIEGLPMAEMPHFTYVPLGFVPDINAGHITPTYPPGLPLLLAISSHVADWTWGPHLLMLVHAIVGIVLAYALVRISAGSKVVGVLVASALALSPLYLAYCIQAMSDLPALVWCTLAIVLAARGTAASAWGCGLAFGLAVLIRPTNLLLGLPLLVIFGRPDKRWLWMLLGSSPAALFMAWFNRSAYGSPFSTGYGDVSEFFAVQWVGVSVAHYVRWLPVVLTPLFLVAVAAPWHRDVPRRLLYAHVLWVSLLATFYLFYFFTHREWWYLRFLLPVFPSLLVLAGLGADVIAARLPRPAVRRGLWVAAAIAIGFNAYTCWHNFDLRNIGQAGARFTAMRQLVAEQVPPDAIVLAYESSGALYFSSKLCIVRWDALDDAWPRLREAAARADRPIYSALFTFETNPKFLERVPGNWRLVGQSGLAVLWRLDPKG